MPRAGVAWEVQLRLDQPALLFSLATAAIATLAFGLFPAFTSTRRDLVGAINSAGRSGTASRGQSRMRSGLVVAEVALSVILLMGAGLLMRPSSRWSASISGSTRATCSWQASHSHPIDRHAGLDAAILFGRARRIRTIPGVQSAAVSTSTPPFGGFRSAVEIPGIALPADAIAIAYASSEDFARTLGLRLLAGRSLSAERRRIGEEGHGR